LVAARLNKQGVHTLAALEYYNLAQREYVDALKAKGFSASEIGTHASLADTALELAVAPNMVRTDKLTNKYGTADGIYGQAPTAATVELGQLGVDLIVDGTVSAIVEFENRK
jgi:creatinine amidohydrolase